MRAITATDTRLKVKKIGMQTTRSADGSSIAYDRYGEGPPVIMLAGAFNTRTTTAPLAEALGDRFTVINPDRRGRGDSGDTSPYAVKREIEDVNALIGEAGGSAAVFGYSSGATLALRAAADGVNISKLALYDAPFVVDDSRRLLAADFVDRLAELVAANRRGEAVELYQREAVGIPDEVVVQMRQAPFRPALEEIAHTLVYEAKVVGDLSFPRETIASVSQPTLVMTGEFSPPIMQGAAKALVEALASAQEATLEGQGHDIDPDVTALPLAKFLSA
jgi:pimeloyl-ACP methyl ester carboxylesterase